MRFNCGETTEEYLARNRSWQRWFAWHPVKVADHDCRWLEVVERRWHPEDRYHDPQIWQYRAIK